MANKPTRSRQQYLDIKAQYPDAILLFRLGDFYEMFDDDAITAARELDIVLTARRQRGATLIAAPLVHHSYHSRPGMLAAELRFLALRCTTRWRRGAALFAAALGHHV